MLLVSSLRFEVAISSLVKNTFGFVEGDESDVFEEDASLDSEDVSGLLEGFSLLEFGIIKKDGN
jgi:hypothetical protein